MIRARNRLRRRGFCGEGSGLLGSFVVVDRTLLSALGPRLGVLGLHLRAMRAGGAPIGLFGGRFGWNPGWESGGVVGVGVWTRCGVVETGREQWVGVVDPLRVADIMPPRSAVTPGGFFAGVVARSQVGSRRCSSVVERTLGKGEVVGSSPTSGFHHSATVPLWRGLSGPAGPIGTAFPAPNAPSTAAVNTVLFPYRESPGSGSRVAQTPRPASVRAGLTPPLAPGESTDHRDTTVPVPAR